MIVLEAYAAIAAIVGAVAGHAQSTDTIAIRQLLR